MLLLLLFTVKVNYLSFLFHKPLLIVILVECLGSLLVERIIQAVGERVVDSRLLGRFGRLFGHHTLVDGCFLVVFEPNKGSIARVAFADLLLDTRRNMNASHARAPLIRLMGELAVANVTGLFVCHIQGMAIMKGEGEGWPLERTARLGLDRRRADLSCAQTARKRLSTST